MTERVAHSMFPQQEQTSNRHHKKIRDTLVANRTANVASDLRAAANLADGCLRRA